MGGLGRCDELFAAGVFFGGIAFTSVAQVFILSS
jgi:hypothetical protein